MTYWAGVVGLVMDFSLLTMENAPVDKTFFSDRGVINTYLPSGQSLGQYNNTRAHKFPQVLWPHSLNMICFNTYINFFVPNVCLYACASEALL